MFPFFVMQDTTLLYVGRLLIAFGVGVISFIVRLSTCQCANFYQTFFNVDNLFRLSWIWSSPYTIVNSGACIYCWNNFKETTGFSWCYKLGTILSWLDFPLKLLSQHGFQRRRIWENQESFRKSIHEEFSIFAQDLLYMIGSGLSYLIILWLEQRLLNKFYFSYQSGLERPLVIISSQARNRAI